APDPAASELQQALGDRAVLLAEAPELPPLARLPSRRPAPRRELDADRDPEGRGARGLHRAPCFAAAGAGELSRDTALAPGDAARPSAACSALSVAGGALDRAQYATAPAAIERATMMATASRAGISRGASTRSTSASVSAA